MAVPRSSELLAPSGLHHGGCPTQLARTLRLGSMLPSRCVWSCMWEVGCARVYCAYPYYHACLSGGRSPGTYRVPPVTCAAVALMTSH
eukprot:7302177-Pyramimonas_sp.AAC.1